MPPAVLQAFVGRSQMVARWKAGCDCPLSRSNACAPESRDRSFASRAPLPSTCTGTACTKSAWRASRSPFRRDPAGKGHRPTNNRSRWPATHGPPDLDVARRVTRVSDSRRTAPEDRCGPAPSRSQRSPRSLRRRESRPRRREPSGTGAPHRSRQGRTMIMRRDDDRRLDRHNASAFYFRLSRPTTPTAARSGTECSRSRSEVDRRRARHGRTAAWAC